MHPILGEKLICVDLVAGMGLSRWIIRCPGCVLKRSRSSGGCSSLLDKIGLFWSRFQVTIRRSISSRGLDCDFGAATVADDSTPRYSHGILAS